MKKFKVKLRENSLECQTSKKVSTATTDAAAHSVEAEAAREVDPVDDRAVVGPVAVPEVEARVIRDDHVAAEVDPDLEVAHSRRRQSSRVFFISRKKRKDANSPVEIVNSVTTNTTIKTGIKIYQIRDWFLGKLQFTAIIEAMEIITDIITDIDEDPDQAENIIDRDHHITPPIDEEDIDPPHVIARPRPERYAYAAITYYPYKEMFREFENVHSHWVRCVMEDISLGFLYWISNISRG